jgi:hypothetical protein
MFSSDKSYFSAVATEVDRARGGRKAATRLRRIFLCLGYVFFCTLLAIGFGGCGQFVENQFKTRAVYDAPTSGFRIIIDASGSIPPSADITTNGVWKAVVTPLSSTTAKVVTIHSISNTSAAFAVDSQPAVTVTWGSSSSKLSFGQALVVAGYTSLSDADVAEAAKAIEGAACGSKATLMSGQTKSLTVVEVKF